MSAFPDHFLDWARARSTVNSDAFERGSRRYLQRFSKASSDRRVGSLVADEVIV
jgi:hypothetical protein